MKNYLGLIDGFSYLYRAYYALPEKKENPVNAIYGVLNMIYSFLLRHNPTHFAIIFDNNKKKTFRHILFKNYKLHRILIPKNLQKQILPLKKIIKKLNIFTFFSNRRFEGDDVIGTIVKKLEHNFKILISTSDKDLLQLVSKNVKILNHKNNIIGLNEIKNQYGISANLIADFLALAGDKSDNIPGVPGIGKKTALLLIKNLGNINDIYNKIDQISLIKLYHSQSIIKNLIDNKKIAFLSYKLASIKKNIPLDITGQTLKIKTSIEKINFYKEKYKKIYYM